jgi:hypothetical protein
MINQAALVNGGFPAQSVAAVAAQLQQQQQAANMLPQLSPQFSTGVGFPVASVASPYGALQQQLFQQQQQQQQQQYQQQLLSSAVGVGYGTAFEQQQQQQLQHMMPSTGPRTYSSLQDIGSDEDDSDQDRF